jgi:uncharacterized protein (DUF1697 family)
VRTYVALLRGINLGRARKVAMADLRTWLTELGYENVRTFLQSGNALFRSDRTPAELEREIGKRLGEQAGFEVRCLIRDHAELRRVVDADPFGDVATNHSRYAVAFLSERPKKARLATLDPDAFAPERFHIGKREIYVWYPDGIHQSRLNNELTERNLGVVATVRNWNTVRRLMEMSADG